MKAIQLFLANKNTSIPGVIFMICLYLSIHPDALTGLMDKETIVKVTGWASLLSGIYTAATSKANTVTGNGSPAAPARVEQSDGSNKAVVPVIAALLIPVLLFSSCASISINKPNAEAALASVVKGALDYTQGNTGATAVDAVQTVAYLLRSIQGTPAAGNPTAVSNAAGQAGASPLADTLANAVSVLTQTGMSGSAANEAVAKQLDKATAQK